MPAAARSAQPHSNPHAGGPASGQSGSKAKLYNPRHPERTLIYQTIAEHFETWHELASVGQFDGQGDHHTPKPFVRQAFRKYLECGIFAHGFARARCDDCGNKLTFKRFFNLTAFERVTYAPDDFLLVRMPQSIIEQDDAK